MKHIYLLLLLMFLTSSLYAQLSRDITKVSKTATGSRPGVPPRRGGVPPAIAGPSIKDFSPSDFNDSTIVKINGKDLSTMRELSYDGQPVKRVVSVSDNQIQVIVGQSATETGKFMLKTAAGSVIFPGTSSVGTDSTANDKSTGDNTGNETIPKASADFTLPDLGQSNLNIIATPTFLLNRIYHNSGFGVSGSFWGNTFGVDSLKEKIGAKFLLPQSSMIGMKFEFAYAHKFSDDFSLSLLGEVNMLFKKVSFLDTATRKTNNFDPFAFHFKPGISASFFNSNILLSAYLNVLSVQTELNKFKAFFNTNSKTTFTYPEIDVSGIFDVGASSNQSVKVGFDFLFNNSNAKYFTGSDDKIIPYLRIGVVSKL